MSNRTTHGTVYPFPVKSVFHLPAKRASALRVRAWGRYGAVMGAIWGGLSGAAWLLAPGGAQGDISASLQAAGTSAVEGAIISSMVAMAVAVMTSQQRVKKIRVVHEISVFPLPAYREACAAA